MSGAAAPRPVTRVVVGVLLRADGAVLLADRPAGKPYPGYWEFPGGKIEAGEAPAAALARELHEELGIDIGRASPWLRFEFDYPHAYVSLHFFRVRHWRGEPHAREGQRLRFVNPADPMPQPLLPAAVPALRWLRLPPAAVLVDQATAAAEASRRGAQPRLFVLDGATAAAIDALRAVARDGDLIVAQGSPALSSADGIVLAADQLAGAPRSGWRGAWVGTTHELEAAARAGCDFALAATHWSVPALPPLPLYSHSASGDDGGHGCWIDARRRRPGLNATDQSAP